MDNVINLVQVLGTLLESMAVAVSVMVVPFALYQLYGKLSRVADRFADADFFRLFIRDQLACGWGVEAQSSARRKRWREGKH